MPEDFAVLRWAGTAQETCTCLNCNELRHCQFCGDSFSRDMTTVSRRTTTHDGIHHYHMHVFISERHKLECPNVQPPLREGVRRVDLMPQMLYGAHNRFQPVSPRVAVDLDTHQWPDQTWLYRAFGHKGDLLYVGITGNVASRMRNHRRSSPWWSLTAHFELARYSHRTEARRAERTAIRMELPRFNIAD